MPRGRSPREYPPEVVELVCGLYRDGLTVREIAERTPKGYRVQTILERYLPERRPAIKRDQAGPKNAMWRGEDAGYQAVHLRMGRAADQRCVDCDEPAADWSYHGSCANELTSDSGTPYCVHPDHYRPRCKACHHAFDWKPRRPNGQLASRKEVMPHV